MALESRITQPAYFTGSARAAFIPEGRDLPMSVFARNFTNKKVIASTFVNLSADAVIYAPPRQIGVGLNYNDEIRQSQHTTSPSTSNFAMASASIQRARSAHLQVGR